VFLVGLPVVHRHRLAGVEHDEADPDLREAAASLDACLEAVASVEPAGLAHVQDEPAVAGGEASVLRLLERGLGNHDQRPSHSRSCTGAARDEKSPSSRIFSAAAANAETATHVSAPPTLTRCAPAATISSIVSCGRARTLTGFERLSHTARISSPLARPG